jgi:hypothetical protein
MKYVQHTKQQPISLTNYQIVLQVRSKKLYNAECKKQYILD